MFFSCNRSFAAFCFQELLGETDLHLVLLPGGPNSPENGPQADRFKRQAGPGKLSIQDMDLKYSSLDVGNSGVVLFFFRQTQKEHQKTQNPAPFQKKMMKHITSYNKKNRSDAKTILNCSSSGLGSCFLTKVAVQALCPSRSSVDKMGQELTKTIPRNLSVFRCNVKKKIMYTYIVSLLNQSW